MIILIILILKNTNIKLIKISSKNELILKTLEDFFIAKGLLNINNIQNEILLDTDEKNLTIHFRKNKTILPLPLDINLVFKEIQKILIDISISIKDFHYFPYQRVLINNEKKILLTDIQNLIFMNLIFSKEGIDKDYLYDLIWNNDKTISINKLDTHLTNLKNHLNNEIGININFQSQKKNLRLLID